MKKIALVGVSGYGKVHLNELMKFAVAGQIQLRAAVVVNPAETLPEQQQLRSLGCTIYPDCNSMWRHESGAIDLACLPVGIAIHEELTCQALSHGANVLLEKPAASTVAAVDRMIAARNRAKRFVAVGFQLYYSPEVSEIDMLLRTGIVGRIQRVAAMGIGPRGDEYYQRNRWAARVVDAAGRPVFDSPFSNAFAHSVNLALHWSHSKVTAVTGCLARVRPEIEMFDSCAVKIDTAAGIPVYGYFSHAAAEAHPHTIMIEGADGVVHWSCASGCWNIRSRAGIELKTGQLAGSEELMFRKILSRLDSPEVQICQLEVAREHTRCIELLQKMPIQTIPSSDTVTFPGGIHAWRTPIEPRIIKWFQKCEYPVTF